MEKLLHKYKNYVQKSAKQRLNKFEKDAGIKGTAYQG
jgi:hypothetical protein